MNNDELMPLAPDLRSLLLDEQAAPPMPPSLQAKLGARLAESMAPVPAPDTGAEQTSGDPSAAAGSAEGAASMSPLASLAAKPALLAASAFALGVGAGVAGTSYYAADSQPIAPEPVLLQAGDAGMAALPPPDATVVVSMDAGPAQLRPGLPTTTPTPRVLSKDDDLAAERSLLELSRTAITRGDAKTALQQLKKHARMHPRGRLAEERDALWVQALVLDGSHEKARAKAALFKRNHPQSLFLPVVEHVLSEAP